MAHEVLMITGDSKTRPEANLAMLRAFHKNLSCPFDLFSLGSKKWCLFEEELFQ